MRKLAILLVLLPVFFLAACGGESSPEDEVTDVADRIIEAESPEEIEQVCRNLLTPVFLEEVYGGKVETCIDQPVSDDGEIENPGEVSVDSVVVDGPKADARIVTVGGDNDGNDGTWAFAEDEGEWKLDRLGDDFLRSTFAVSVAIVDEGVMSYEPMRKCMSGQVAKLKSAELRKFMFEVTRDAKEKATDSVLSIAKACPKPMAEFVADELATQVLADKGASEAQVRCARKKMAPLLQVTGLSSIALGEGDYGSALGPALAGLISGVLKQCPAR